MVRRVSTSQLRQKIRNYNRAVDNYNREIRRINQQRRQRIQRYNQAVRTYNSRLRAYQQKLKSEVARLNRTSNTIRYTTLKSSTQALHQTYLRMEQSLESNPRDGIYNRILDLSEREAANSVHVTNAVLDDEAYNEEGQLLPDSTLGEELKQISTDLHERWQGALYALNPRNPDAARHFCTSAREVITQILEIKAPDTQVLQLMPNCQVTENGKPTRRSKINFLLSQKDMAEEALGEFIEKDVDNIVELFRVFNDGTHGSAGTFNMGQLSAIKKRVEDGVFFLAEVAA